MQLVPEVVVAAAAAAAAIIDYDNDMHTLTQWTTPKSTSQGDIVFRSSGWNGNYPPWTTKKKSNSDIKFDGSGQQQKQQNRQKTPGRHVIIIDWWSNFLVNTP